MKLLPRINRRPRAIPTTLGRFLSTVQEATVGEPDEKVLVCTWGPILPVLPTERRSWRAPV